MCEKQKRIEELEIENAKLYNTLAETFKLSAEERKLVSETHKLSAEREKLLTDAMKTVRDMKYQPLLLLTPLIVSLIALVATIAK